MAWDGTTDRIQGVTTIIHYYRLSLRNIDIKPIGLHREPAAVQRRYLLLGEQIGEITGIVTGQRVLDVEEDCPK